VGRGVLPPDQQGHHDIEANIILPLGKLPFPLSSPTHNRRLALSQ